MELEFLVDFALETRGPENIQESLDGISVPALAAGENAQDQQFELAQQLVFSGLPQSPSHRTRWDNAKLAPQHCQEESPSA
jgi:hypothetical protein